MTVTRPLTFQVVYIDASDKWFVIVVPAQAKDGFAVPGYATATEAYHRCHELNTLGTLAP